MRSSQPFPRAQSQDDQPEPPVRVTLSSSCQLYQPAEVLPQGGSSSVPPGTLPAGSVSHLWCACVCACVCARFYPRALQGAPRQGHAHLPSLRWGVASAPGGLVPASPALCPQGPCISYVPLCLLAGPAFFLGPSSSPGRSRAPCPQAAEPSPFTGPLRGGDREPGCRGQTALGTKGWTLHGPRHGFMSRGCSTPGMAPIPPLSIL